ncbi:transcription factor HES-3 [Protopterus annectens]|uniref:transcription factor HES-3 n=1 Tax=Protopterus annectens TaxID=7888 RepID=UPI001CFBC729|nr:transcription factor HES-3 [Protopterus annectens]
MEKKRRARINVSLEQLKTLLENHYAHNIKKRKLEKADILELTVKYLKSLQTTRQGVSAYRSMEYEAGFRSCLNGVNQYFMRNGELSEDLRLSVLRDIACYVAVGKGLNVNTTDSVSNFSTADSTSQFLISDKVHSLLPESPYLMWTTKSEQSQLFTPGINPISHKINAIGLAINGPTPTTDTPSSARTPDLHLFNTLPNRQAASTNHTMEQVWRPW